MSLQCAIIVNKHCTCTDIIFANIFCSSNFLQAYATDQHYYISLQYNATTNTHLWDDSTPLGNWNYWSSGEPVTTTDLCTVADPSNNWRWKSTDCSDTKYSICQYGLGKFVVWV